MIEVLDKKNIKWFSIGGGFSTFVIRENKLYKIDKTEILQDEIYCKIIQTPCTPPDHGLSLYRKGNIDKWGFDKQIKEVINSDYLHPEAIMNFILGIGYFKNYWESKEEAINNKRIELIKKMIKDEK